MKIEEIIEEMKKLESKITDMQFSESYDSLKMCEYRNKLVMYKAMLEEIQKGNANG